MIMNWKLASGISGTVQISSEAEVYSITAFGGENSTLQIDSFEPIIIPLGCKIVVKPSGALKGASFVFTNTTSYLIEYTEPN